MNEKITLLSKGYSTGRAAKAQRTPSSENRKLFFFAPSAQPEADPSQPKADPSSGGLWRSLGAIIFVKIDLLSVISGRFK